MRNLYPELSDDQFQDLIVPLEKYDDVVCHTLGGIGLAGVRERWCLAEEAYPFQRFIRSLAAGVCFPEAVVLTAFESCEAPYEVFLGRLEGRLRSVLDRPLVVALNAARVDGVLVGDSPNDRYESYVDGLVSNGLAALGQHMSEILDSRIKRIISNEVSLLAELSARLCCDFSAIRDVFGVEGKALRYSASSGDTHHGGRSVCVIEFAGRKVVYKPRDVSGEVAFGKVLDVGRKFYGLTLESIDVVSRDGYGYAEFVEEVEDIGDMSEFFAKSGEMLAVLYLLNARDMHFENILATVDGPVAIDLETLMHPRVLYTGDVPEVPGNASAVWDRSVASIGVLPAALSSQNAEGDYVDVGFLGEGGGRVSPFKTIQYENAFTDTMKLKLDQTNVPERSTISADTAPEDAGRLGHVMADRFEQILEAVRVDSAPWLEAIETYCPDVCVRYVHKGTMDYSKLLRLSSSSMAIAGEEIQLAVLKRIALQSADSDERLVGSELVQLAMRDVPYFYTKADSKAIYSAGGGLTGAELDEAPLDEARAKVLKLDDVEIRRNSEMIRIAFVSKFPSNLRELKPHKSNDRVGEEILLERLADEIAVQLMETVLPDRFADHPPTWLGPVMSSDPERPWSSEVLGFDLYVGRIGPALALLAAGEATANKKWIAIATEIIDKTADMVLPHESQGGPEDWSAGEGFGAVQLRCSAFAGLSGSAFVLGAAAELANNGRWSLASQKALKIVEEQTMGEGLESQPLDVIDGLAGVALVGCSQPTAWAAGFVDRIVEQLCAAVLAEDERTKDMFQMSGFGHGVAGIIHTLSVWQLARAEEETETGRAVAKALEMLSDKLSSLFDPGKRRWKSNTGSDPGYETGWCHGSGGILLALDSFERASGQSQDQFINLALMALGEDGFGRNLTWCHGDLGNFDAVWAVKDRAQADRLLHSENVQRWFDPSTMSPADASRDSRYRYTNGLLLGSSGVLLHVANRLNPAVTISPTRLTYTTAGGV